MKTCPHCGASLAPDAGFCTNCGQAYVEPQQPEAQAAPPQYYQAAPQQQPGDYQQSDGSSAYSSLPENPDDKPNIGLAILAFFIPLAGLIMFFTMKDATPKKAKNIAMWAGIGFGVNIVLGICCGSFWGVLMAMLEGMY